MAGGEQVDVETVLGFQPFDGAAAGPTTNKRAGGGGGGSGGGGGGSGGVRGPLRPGYRCASSCRLRTVCFYILFYIVLFLH